MVAHTRPSGFTPVPRAKTLAATVSIVANATLIAFKLAAGVLTGSVAVLTEALHSSIDVVASVLAYFSVHAASKPPDGLHRYGHDKIENLTAGIEGILILGGSALIAREALHRLGANSPVRSPGVAIGVIAVSALVNVALTRYLSRSARSTGSVALEGNATHVRTDVATSLGVLAGLVLAAVTGQRWVDPATALVLAVVIIASGVRLLRRSWGVLIDEGLSDEELAIIHDVLRDSSLTGVTGYHRLRTRRAGARQHIDLHLRFDGAISLERAHASSHQVQRTIYGRLPDADVLIHLEPEPARAVRGDGCSGIQLADLQLPVRRRGSGAPDGTRGVQAPDSSEGHTATVPQTNGCRR